MMAARTLPEKTANREPNLSTFVCPVEPVPQ
jgi:hypothetical protein